MLRVVVAVVVGAVVIGAVVVAGPALAQQGADAETTGPGGSGDTTSVPGTDTTTSLPPLEGGDGGDGPGGSLDPGDDETPELDPIVVIEARSEGERTAYAVRSRIRELASARLDAAVEQSEAARARLDEITSRYIGESAAVQDRADALDATQLDYQRLVEDYRAARDDLQERVTLLYAGGPSAELETAIRSGDLLEVARRELIMTAVIEAGHDEVVERYLTALDDAPGGIDEERAEIFEVRDYLEDLSEARSVLRDQAEAADAELDEVIDDIVADAVFPVGGTDYNFIDSFLFCRDGCRRRHQGVDIMAPQGTPLLAVENGVLFRFGTGRLGGIKLWLLGESGTAYYYAHLSGYAEGATEGAYVRAGTTIGFVGNTGNAISTPPHLHLEVHPNADGRAVNPYPLMRQAADLRELGPDPLDGIG